MSYFDQGNEKDKLELLKTFCANALRAKDENGWLYIIGGLISMRKALELMDVDILKNHSERGSWKSDSVEKIRLNSANIMNVANTAFPERHDFLKLHKGIRDLYSDISKWLHYQAYMCLLDDEGDSETIFKAEMAQMKGMCELYWVYVDGLFQFVHTYADLTEVYDIVESWPECKKWEESLSSFDDVSIFWKKNCKDLKAECENAESQGPSVKTVYHPLMLYCTKVLNLCAENYYSPLEMDSVYLCNRMIAECYCVMQINEYDRSALKLKKDKDGDLIPPTLANYTTALESLINAKVESADRRGFSNAIRTVKNIQGAANDVDHIVGESAQRELLNKEILDKTKTGRDWIEDTNNLYSYGGYLLQRIVNEWLPESIGIWLRRYDDAIQKYIREIERREKIIRILMIAVAVLVVVIIAGAIYFWSTVSHPGDPTPALSDGAAVATDWDEIPEVSASIDGVALQPGAPQALASTGSAPELLISARDAGENSLKWSGNSRFMKLQGAAVNDAGIAMLQCKLATVDAAGSEISAVNIPVTNDSAWAMSGQAPGRYMLRVQAVGAADGLRQGGKELNAATGWIEYPILLLPEPADWTLRNDNTGDVVAESESLDAFAGDVLAAGFDSAIDGAILRARWDAGEEWTAMEDGKFRVPGDLAAGNHVLHLSAAYEFMGREIDANCNEDFSLIVQQVVQEEPEAERRVQIRMWDQDGTTLEDGSTWIASPGDTLCFEGYAPNGIESWNFTQIDENGEKREWTRPGTDRDVDLSEPYGQPSFTVTLEAVEKGGDAAGRSSVSLRVLCRTKGNEYDDNKNVTKEWLYGDPASNEPTGYILRDYDEQNRVTETSYWDAGGEPVYGDQGHYHRMTTEYDGDDEKSFIYDLDGETLIDGDPEVFDGAAGVAHITDAENNTDEWQYFGTDGKLKRIDRGYASFIQYKDDQGNILHETHYDENGDPVIREGGYCVYDSAYDNDNNETDAWFYGTDGKTPALWYDSYHHAHYTYDDSGNRLTEEYFGVDGEPCVPPDKGYTRAEFTYDAKKHKTSAIYYDLEGAIYQDGYAKWVRTYEPGTDNELSCAYQDADGRAVTNSRYGYAYCDKRYDENGKECERWYRDEQGRPVAGSDGFARWEHKREATDGGTLETWAYYDAEGQLVVPKSQDWALAESEYDARGNCIVHRHKGADGELTGTSELDGAAYVTYRYNGSEKTGEFYYSADGTPHLIGNAGSVNYYGWSYAKDPQDDRVYYMRYLGADGQPIENELGIYQVKNTRDEAGNVIREERFTRENVYPSGDAVRIIEWTFFDGTDKVQSEREISELGSTERLYDEDGHVISTSYYDGNGGKQADEHGVWKYTWEYEKDEGGRMVITRACYGADEELTVGPDGFAKLKMEYDKYEYVEDRLRPRDGRYYDSPYEDDYGNTYEERHYGADGQLIVNDQVGYAVYRRTATVSSYAQEFEDARGVRMENPNAGFSRFEQTVSTLENGHSLTTTAYYDAQDKLVVVESSGFAKREEESDDSENIDALYPYIWLDDGGDGPFYEERYYGADGKPMIYSWGDGKYSYAVFRRETTATQNTVEYRGVDDKLMGYGPEGVARIVKKYAGGEMVSKAYFGADEKPILNEYGFAEERWTYDEDGELAEHKFLNVDGKPMLNEYGTYAIETWTGEDGRVTHSYLGEDGELRINPFVGYAAIVEERSDAEVRTYYLGEDGEKAVVEMSGYGYAERFARRIEVDGMQGIEVTFLDAKGDAIVPPELGFSRVIQLEDDQGRVVEQRFYDGDDPVYVDSFPLPWNSGKTAIIRAERIRWTYDDSDEENAIYGVRWLKKEEGAEDLVEYTATYRGDEVIADYTEGIGRFSLDDTAIRWHGLDKTDHIVAVERLPGIEAEGE